MQQSLIGRITSVSVGPKGSLRALSFVSTPVRRPVCSNFPSVSMFGYQHGTIFVPSPCYGQDRRGAQMFIPLIMLAVESSDVIALRTMKLRSRLIKSPIEERRPDSQRRDNFEPACHNVLQYGGSPSAC